MKNQEKKPQGDNKFHLHIQTKYRTQRTPSKKDRVEKELRKTKGKYGDDQNYELGNLVLNTSKIFLFSFFLEGGFLTKEKEKVNKKNEK